MPFPTVTLSTKYGKIYFIVESGNSASALSDPRGQPVLRLSLDGIHFDSVLVAFQKYEAPIGWIVARSSMDLPQQDRKKIQGELLRVWKAFERKNPWAMVAGEAEFLDRLIGAAKIEIELEHRRGRRDMAEWAVEGLKRLQAERAIVSTEEKKLARQGGYPTEIDWDPR